MVSDALPTLKVLVKGRTFCTIVPYPTNTKIKINNLSEKYFKKVCIMMIRKLVKILQFNIKSLIKLLKVSSFMLIHWPVSFSASRRCMSSKQVRDRANRRDRTWLHVIIQGVLSQNILIDHVHDRNSPFVFPQKIRVRVFLFFSPVVPFPPKVTIT